MERQGSVGWLPAVRRVGRHKGELIGARRGETESDLCHDKLWGATVMAPQDGDRIVTVKFVMCAPQMGGSLLCGNSVSRETPVFARG